MQQVRGNISLVLATPVASEWNLEGQAFGLNADIKSTVSLLIISFPFI